MKALSFIFLILIKLLSNPFLPPYPTDFIIISFYRSKKIFLDLISSKGQEITEKNLNIKA